MQSKVKLQMHAVIPWSLFVGLGVYLLMFGFNSLTRTRIFMPDGMNYVNVAQNIRQGKGITQSTLGFNQARFAAQDPIPTPFVAQPPLYPLLIALCRLSKLSYTDSALLISTVCYGGILGIAFALAVRLYDIRVGYLFLGLLLLYYPLRSVAGKACSEPLGILFVLLSLWLLVRTRAASDPSLLITGAGLLSGLAFATRYLFAPLYGMGLLLLCSEVAPWRKRLPLLGLYTVGFAVPACVVIGRNRLILGTMMPLVNPSTIGLKGNVVATAKNLFGMYVGIQYSNRQFVFIAMLLLSLCLVLIIKKSFVVGLQNVFLRKERFLLIAWTGGYLGFLILERSHFHFDSISPRLIVPAGVTAVLLCAAFLVESVNMKVIHIQAVLLTVLCLCMEREMETAIKMPPYRVEQALFQSERLRWIAEHTSRRDLIIGDDTMDVPFYLPDRVAVSFSPYPYTDYASYQGVIDFCQAHRRNYNKMYLILRRDLKPEPEWRLSYGPFFTELMFGRSQIYPDVLLLYPLKDAYVFEIQHHPGMELPH